MHGASDLQQDQIIKLFPKYAIYMIVAFLIPITVLVTYLSNKIYGPIYSFEKYLKALLNNESPKEFNLRKGDQLKHLEKTALEMKKRIQK